MKTSSLTSPALYQKGLTLIEVMVVLLVVSIGLMATAKFQGDLLHEGGTNKARIQALSHASDKVEALRIDHDSAAGGHSVETGANAQYLVNWTVGSFAGITDAQHHSASVTWTDTLNRSQAMMLSSVAYPDRLYTDPEGAANCIYGSCSLDDPDPPVVTIAVGGAEDMVGKYRYPITLTITPEAGYGQVALVVLENNVPNSMIEGGSDNGDGHYTLAVNISHQVTFDLLSDAVYGANGLDVDVGATWVQREPVVTIVLKESP